MTCPGRLSPPDPEGPPSVDLERLAEAMYNVWPHHMEGSGGTGEPPEGGWQHWRVTDPAIPTPVLAEAIAAEYARLSPVDQGTEPTE